MRSGLIGIAAANGDLVIDGVRDRRTPKYSQTDLNLVHELKLSKTNEQLRLGFEANIINLFNQHAAVAYGSQITNEDLAIDPALNVPASSLSGFDYPTFLKHGFDWVKEFNDEGQITSKGYGFAQQFQQGRNMRFKIKFVF